MMVPYLLYMLIRGLPNDVTFWGCSAGHSPASTVMTMASLPGIPQRVWSAGQRQSEKMSYRTQMFAIVQALFSWSMEVVKLVCNLNHWIILMAFLLNSLTFLFQDIESGKDIKRRYGQFCHSFVPMKVVK